MTLANELSRNGRRSGLTFAPEGGTDRIRKVINKMVTEDDLIETVRTAYANGWRQVKLYFMCGLPTETDEDVLAIARVARRVIQAGRQATGRGDIRCTVSIGGFVPKPHTPFQWAAQCGHETVDARLRALGAELRADRSYGRAIGFRYHDGRPSMVEGLLSRGDRRVGAVIRAVWQDGGRFDGWSEYFSYDRWVRCAADALAGTGVDLDWYTTRERGYDEILPWDHLDSGLDRDWLWQDWQDAIDPAGAAEVDDCRWTPCFECGVCPAMGTEIETGPSGVKLLPLDNCAKRAAMTRQVPTGPPPAPVAQRLVIRYAKRGRMRFASHRDTARVVRAGGRRAQLPIAYSAGFSPHLRISYVGGAPTGTASEAEYLETRPYRAVGRRAGAEPARRCATGGDRCNGRF